MRKLHPNLVPWLKDFHDNAEKSLAEGFKATPTNAREFLTNLTRRYVTKTPDLPYIQDDLVPTLDYRVPVRIYHPKPAEKLPVLIYFHGGGHMCGSVSDYDPIARKLAIAANHLLVSVDYRRSPENPYPAGVLDALGVVRSIWPVLDQRGISYKKELSIAGDSGGGALAATVSGRTQYEAGVLIKRQVLIYPSVDYAMTQPSIEENATGFLLQKAKLIWYFENYFAHGENWKGASPLFWDFTANLPETLVMTAEFCPLRDEGALYARKVKEAGVGCEYYNFEDMVHTFVNMEDLVPEACEKLYTMIGEFLQKP